MVGRDATKATMGQGAKQRMKRSRLCSRVAILATWTAVLFFKGFVFFPASGFLPSSSSTRSGGGVTAFAKPSTTSSNESARDVESTDNGKRRKKKKNKYASHSKVADSSKDPLEALMEESLAKNEDIQRERDARKKRVDTDPRRVVDGRSSGKRSSSVSSDGVAESRVRNKMEFPPTDTIDPYDPTTYGFTELGVVTAPHGVRGELRLTLTTRLPEERLRPPPGGVVRHLRLPNRRSPREVRLTSGRPRSDEEWLVSLAGVGSRDAAARLRGAVLYAHEDDRPSVEEGEEWLLRDLVGSEVYAVTDDDASSGARVGRVVGIVLAEEIGSVPGLGNDLLEIAVTPGDEKGELVLVPFVRELVPRVDVEAKTIFVDPPPGLLDLTYVRQENVKIKGYLPPGR